MLDAFAGKLAYVEPQQLQAGRVYQPIQNPAELIIAAPNENNIVVGVSISQTETSFTWRDVSTYRGFIDYGELEVECAVDAAVFKEVVSHQDDNQGCLVVGPAGPVRIAMAADDRRRQYYKLGTKSLEFADMGGRHAICAKWRIRLPGSLPEGNFLTVTVDLKTGKISTGKS